MKSIFINGGPRKNWTTVKLMKQAMGGTSDAGAETELIHLYDFDFKGCMSCFACKLKNSKCNGVCALKDSIRPVLEKAHEADVIVMGSPVYFSYPTGVLRAFMERLFFPINSYNPKIDENGKMLSSLLGKFVPTAMIYTMGFPEKRWRQPVITRRSSARMPDFLNHSLVIQKRSVPTVPISSAITLAMMSWEVRRNIEPSTVMSNCQRI